MIQLKRYPLNLKGLLTIFEHITFFFSHSQTADSVTHKQPTQSLTNSRLERSYSPYLSRINIVLYKRWPTNNSVNHQRDYWNCFSMNQWQTNQYLYSSGSTELANYSSAYLLRIQDVRTDERQLAQMENLCRLPTDHRLRPRLARNLP